MEATVELPPVTVGKARFLAVGLEMAYREHREEFLATMAEHRALAREYGRRSLNGGEALSAAAQIAPALGLTAQDDVTGLARQIQESDVVMVRDPEPLELMIAAAGSLGPAALQTGTRILAALEVPWDHDPEAFGAAVSERVGEYEDMPVDVVVRRATAAFALMDKAYGAGAGSGFSTVLRSVWAGLQDSARDMADRISETNPLAVPAADTAGVAGEGGQTP